MSGLFSLSFGLEFFVILIQTVVLLLLLYWVFCVPWNWTKDLTQVGYNFAITSELRKDAVKRRDVINRIRRFRKISQNDPIPSPFPNGWYAITESVNVGKEKSISVSCLGEQFVVFRTREGHVNVLDAYCPHMGANLGIGGRVVGDRVVCPFHQWSFRGSDGKCVDIPYSKCAIPQNAKVKKWTSSEVNGYIFVWYHAENEEPWVLPIIEEIQSNELVYHGRNEYYVNCHIQDIPENGADLAHFTAIHKDSFLAGGDLDNKFIIRLGSHHWTAEWKGSESDNKHVANVFLTHSISILQKIKLCTVTVRAEQIGPSYVQLQIDSKFGKCVILQTICPIEPLLQKVIHRFYGPRMLGPIMKFFIWGESVMFERDVNIWNHKMFLNSPCLVKEDGTIKLFRNWYNQFYTENSKSFAHAKENLNW